MRSFERVHADEKREKKKKQKEREKRKTGDERKKRRGNYKGTRDHGKTRVPANSVFPVYEGALRR